MRRNYTSGAHEKSNSREDVDVEIDIIFCEACVYAVDCNFFGKGPLQHIKPGQSAKQDVTSYDGRVIDIKVPCLLCSSTNKAVYRIMYTSAI